MAKDNGPPPNEVLAEIVAVFGEQPSLPKWVVKLFAMQSLQVGMELVLGTADLGGLLGRLKDRGTILFYAGYIAAQKGYPVTIIGEKKEVER